MKVDCDLCGKEIEVDKMLKLLYADGDKLGVCKECWDRETSRGDWAYEQMKERDYEKE